MKTIYHKNISEKQSFNQGFSTDLQMKKPADKTLIIMSGILGISLASLGMKKLRKTFFSPQQQLKGKKILITGGSRGLGFALAEQFAKNGASVFICARNPKTLEVAREKLLKYGTEIITFPCDLSKLDQVEKMIQNVISHFKSIDVLVNNAGVMEVGPLEEFDLKKIQEVIDINLLGMIRVTLGLLSHLKKGARIINITSIGGVVAVPHLLAYTVSKFGALGFSLGLDAELAKYGITVTSVIPGLMRTGSFVHAFFLGKSKNEFNWFSLGANLPLLSISAHSAAEKIIHTSLIRKRYVVLGPQAKALRLFYQLFPNWMLGGMRIMNRLLPKVPSTITHESTEGVHLRQNLIKGGKITLLGDQAGDELNENIAA